MSSTQSIAFFREAPLYRHQYQADSSPTIPSNMRKKLSADDGSNLVGNNTNTVEFLSAPKRKRGDSIDDISASRQQEQSDDDDDDFIFPLHKRSASSTRLQSAFCVSSYDSEARDGPAEDDNRLDDETSALVKNFRTSIFRYEPVSPSSIPSSYKEDDEEEDDQCIGLDFPSIGRATTICDDSSENDDYEDPPDMASNSRPASPNGEEILGQDDYYRSSDPIDETRERPEWLSAAVSLSPRSTSSTEDASQEPSPLWTMTQGKDTFWQSGWTGMFHQGSA